MKLYAEAEKDRVEQAIGPLQARNRADRLNDRIAEAILGWELEDRLNGMFFAI